MLDSRESLRHNFLLYASIISSCCRSSRGDLSKAEDVFPIDPLFHEGWYRVSSFCHDRALHTCVTFGGKVGRKKKGSAKRLNAPLSSLRERTRTIVSENARLPCTVGLEF